jgi:hypothetical protein
MRASVPEVLHHCPARYKEPSRNRGTWTNGRGFADRLRLTCAVFGAQANSRFLVASLLGMTRLFASCRHSRFAPRNDKMGLLAADIRGGLASLLGMTRLFASCRHSRTARFAPRNDKMGLPAAEHSQMAGFARDDSNRAHLQSETLRATFLWRT